jgi:tripartite-type tricarboxylate transporter receptor subunit TctC
MKYRKRFFLAAIATSMIGVYTGGALANDFYKDTTIRVVVGYAAGGGYDTYARAVARHMGKHIPGNPEFVVENMTGAGSLIAANYTYNKADRDGTFLGVWNSSFVLFQALGDGLYGSTLRSSTGLARRSRDRRIAASWLLPG